MTRTILLVLTLTSCAAMDRNRICRQNAGPEPHPAAGLLGIAGALLADQDPAQHDWNVRVRGCMMEDGP